MDFTVKNFRYTTMEFGDFAKRVLNGGRFYLRALSHDAPADQAASLEQDFPSLAADFVLPNQLRACQDNIHSSVLRISGPVNMWLHYGMQEEARSLNSPPLANSINARCPSQCVLSDQR